MDAYSETAGKELSKPPVLRGVNVVLCPPPRQMVQCCERERWQPGGELQGTMTYRA